MAIVIPNRNEKLKSQIIDAFRIEAWKSFKTNYEGNLKGLELYEEFKKEWEVFEIHKMTFAQLKKFMEKYEYTLSDIQQIRTEYYQQRNQYQEYVNYKQFSDNVAQTIHENETKTNKNNNNLDDSPF
jgi:hypothetical protein